MQRNTTSYIVIGAGVVVTLIGWYVGGNWGSGIMGFGLAHILLGTLDLFRPAVKTE